MQGFTQFLLLKKNRITIFILVINQLDAQNLFFNKFINPCTGRPPICVMISEAVQYSFDLLMMSTLCSKHVET